MFSWFHRNNFVYLVSLYVLADPVYLYRGARKDICNASPPPPFTAKEMQITTQGSKKKERKE